MPISITWDSRDEHLKYNLKQAVTYQALISSAIIVRAELVHEP